MRRRILALTNDPAPTYFYAAYHDGGSPSDMDPTALAVSPNRDIYIVCDSAADILPDMYRLNRFGIFLSGFEYADPIEFPLASIDDYVFTIGNGSDSGNEAVFLHRLDRDGDYDSLYRVSGGGSPDNNAYGIAEDGTSIFVLGNADTGTEGGQDIAISKIAISGLTLTWAYNFGSANNENLAAGTCDSSGNTYFVCSDSTNSDHATVAKISSAGAITWQREIDFNNAGYSLMFPTTTVASAKQIAVDSSGNVYVFFGVSTTPTVSADFLFLAKYNSSGTLQWQRSITGADRAHGIQIDSSDELIICGREELGSGRYGVMLAKVTAAGAVSWKREFSPAYDSLNPVDMAVDSDDDIIVLVDDQSTPNPIGASSTAPLGVLKVPGDGTLTGSHGDPLHPYTYTTSSAAFTTSFYSESAGSLTGSSASGSLVSDTGSASSVSLTRSFTRIE